MSTPTGTGSFNSNLFEAIKHDAVERTVYRNARAADVSAAMQVGSNLYIDQSIMPPGSMVQPQRERIVIEQNTVMVFADDAPGFNWAHPCHYLLYQLDQQVVQEVEARLPPYLTKIPETYQLFYETTRAEDTGAQIAPASISPEAAGHGNKYAVLFSGASNYRHVNDLEFLYRTLVDSYQYPEENIYVLNYDGTLAYSALVKSSANWPGDNTPYRMKVTAEGTKSEFENVIDDLAKRLQADDSLLIHTNNHGDRNKAQTESLLLAYSGPDYAAGDLAAKLAQLPAFNRLIVMMEQCHSGGFNAPILANSPATLTTVAAACDATKSSYGGANFNHFARDWIAAMNGLNPYGAALAFNPDVDGSGGVTAHEAFSYADKIKNPNDTPQYSQSSAQAGDCQLG